MRKTPARVAAERLDRVPDGVYHDGPDRLLEDPNGVCEMSLEWLWVYAAAPVSDELLLLPEPW